jgi:hypothetical protein
MLFEVEMNAFADGKIREVRVPGEEMLKAGSVDDVLELVFHFGQNDFQPVQGLPSVSVGDVIRYKNKRYEVDCFGFSLVGVYA